MRNGTVEGYQSPHPLIEGLPGLYQEDDFTRRWLSAMDDALAPVFLALDSMPAYLDPELTPDDFLDWLASWVGVLLDENWPIERRRAFVAQAAELYRLRGTTAGLAAHVRIFTGGDVEILESGGVHWSKRSGSDLPGTPGYRIEVRVKDTDTPVDPARLDALVATAKPAHVVHRVRVTGGTKTAASTPAAAAPEPTQPPPAQPPAGEPPTSAAPADGTTADGTSADGTTGDEAPEAGGESTTD
jgi:phage tail-like protein